MIPKLNEIIINNSELLEDAHCNFLLISSKKTAMQNCYQFLQPYPPPKAPGMQYAVMPFLLPRSCLDLLLWLF